MLSRYNQRGTNTGDEGMTKWVYSKHSEIGQNQKKSHLNSGYFVHDNTSFKCITTAFWHRLIS